MVKEIIDKIKRQSTKWEKTSANYMTDEWLIPEMYKQLKQLNIKRLNNSTKSDQKPQIQIFPKKRIYIYTYICMCIYISLHRQQAHGKMPQIINHQRNVDRNHNAILSHICQNDHHQNIYKKQPLARMWSKGNPSTLLVEM